ncbi:MAG: YidB family protein [Rhodopila sp.]
MSLGTLLGGLLGGSGGSPLQGVLMGLLGGQQSSVGQGGLGGLVSSFQQAGLGDVVQSWIGHGPNQPVEPGQLRQVLGDEQVQSMASQSGMAPTDFLSQLSQHLPRAVDSMTPNGRLPDEGSVSV